jgi:hypothetical protein
VYTGTAKEKKKKEKKERKRENLPLVFLLCLVVGGWIRCPGRLVFL